MRPLTAAEYQELCELASDVDWPTTRDDPRFDTVYPRLQADGFVVVVSKCEEDDGDFVWEILEWGITDAGRRAIRVHCALLGAAHV